MCSAIGHMSLPMVGMRGDITRSFEKFVKPQKALLAHDRKSSVDLFCMLRLLTPLQKEMSNAKEIHSCRGKRLVRRSRYRRFEALLHHSGGTNGRIGGQT